MRNRPFRAADPIRRQRILAQHVERPERRLRCNRQLLASGVRFGKTNSTWRFGRQAAAQRAFHDPHRLMPTAAGFDPHPDVMAEPAPKAADVGGELLSARPRAIIAPRARLEAAGGCGHREIPLHADPRAWSVSKQSVKRPFQSERAAKGLPGPRRRPPAGYPRRSCVGLRDRASAIRRPPAPPGRAETP